VSTRTWDLPNDAVFDARRSLIQLALAFGVILCVAVTPMVAERLARVPTTPIAATADSKCWSYKPSERGFARKINAARAAAGKRKLSIDPELSRVARTHTWTMAGKDLLHHQSETDLRRRVVNWSTLGENVGVGFSTDSLHRAFMASPAHKHNILYSSFRHTGVGVREVNGRMWVTVLFEATNDPGTTLNMPRCS
jgi:uncharacterized protein YkwD